MQSHAIGQGIECSSAADRNSEFGIVGDRHGPRKLNQ